MNFDLEIKIMAVYYRSDIIPAADEVIELYKLTKLTRPYQQPERVAALLVKSDLLITAWMNHQLIGMARSITDWHWICYLADLMVHPDFQKKGIGKALLEHTKQLAGPETALLLLSVPQAVSFYHAQKMYLHERCFVIDRQQ